MKNSVQEIRAGALLTVNNYIEDFIWGIHSTKYLFYSDSEDKNDNFSSFGAAVLLKFDTLQSLETYIKSVYYNTYPMILYFRV